MQKVTTYEPLKGAGTFIIMFQAYLRKYETSVKLHSSQQTDREREPGLFGLLSGIADWEWERD